MDYQVGRSRKGEGLRLPPMHSRDTQLGLMTFKTHQHYFHVILCTHTSAIGIALVTYIRAIFDNFHKNRWHSLCQANNAW